MGSCNSTPTTQIKDAPTKPKSKVIQRRIYHLPMLSIHYTKKANVEVSKSQALSGYLFPVKPEMQESIDAMESCSKSISEVITPPKINNLNQLEKVLQNKKKPSLTNGGKSPISIIEPTHQRAHNISHSSGKYKNDSILFKGNILKFTAGKLIPRYGVIDKDYFRYYTKEYDFKKWMSKPLSVIKTSIIIKAIRLVFY